MYSNRFHHNKHHHVKMYNFKELFDSLSNEGKIVATISGFFGYMGSLFLLDVDTFSWEFVVKAFGTIILTAITVLVGLVIKDVYVVAKPHLILISKTVYLNIKTKINRYGKSDKKEKRA